jgi:phosphoadenosine phosphosulfate reductase
VFREISPPGSGVDFDPEYAALSDASLEEATAEAVVNWALGKHGDLRVAVTSAFGPEGCVLVELVRRQKPTVPIYSIDTGVLFPETIEVREAYRQRGANIVVMEPLITLKAQAERHGERLWERAPDDCCEIRKVEPMRRVLDRVDVWLTAVRRDQADTRARTPVVGTARRRDGTLVLKVAPLARWGRADTWRFLLDHGLPYNRLLDDGYTSIGCLPCTRRPGEGESERAGRWSGSGKVECGIHNL